MEFKVVPFVASVGQAEGSQQAATQLQDLITSHAAADWEFVRLESVETYIAGNAGCFGIGATPAQLVSYSMAVFRR